MLFDEVAAGFDFVAHEDAEGGRDGGGSVEIRLDRVPSALRDDMGRIRSRDSGDLASRGCRL